MSPWGAARVLVLALALAACASRSTPSAEIHTAADTDTAATAESSGGEATSTPPTRMVVFAGSVGLTFSGMASGSVSATRFGPDCVGYSALLPDHVVWVEEPLPTFVLRAQSTSDTILAVRTPTGEVLCDDDGGGHLDPQVVLAAEPGRYEIWIGTYRDGGVTVPYQLTLSSSLGSASASTETSAVAADAAGAFAEVPRDCGMATPEYGPLRVGSSVVLGAHSGWTGPDGHGGHVIEDVWWNEAMSAYVGRRTVVTELAGLDPAGCPHVRVAVDGGSWGWRIRDLGP